ncbi:hypothetical protein DBR24_06985 [Pseudomonas sp. HMWF006]|nr:hypothetical protein DBR24_06985 [Pseudomonas sp. HMWF006]PTT65970.1 hypothetical protein DBR26_18525 [Pseudomonas sp. HMWF007]PTT88825.1 hypothetical protein DBR29_16970 [Pseudomonas sp. HMWF005]
MIHRSPVRFCRAGLFCVWRFCGDRLASSRASSLPQFDRVPSDKMQIPVGASLLAKAICQTPV